MKILLKLKSWQLFVVTWFIPILIIILLFKIDTLTAIYLSIIFIPIGLISFFIGTLGWIWAISIHMNDKLPDNAKLKTGIFKLSSIIVTLFCIGIILKSILVHFGYFGFDMSITTKASQAIFIVIFSIIIWTTRFAAIAIKSIELGRMAKFSEYYMEFFLISFSFIGYWIIQPRINRIMNNKF